MTLCTDYPPVPPPLPPSPKTFLTTLRGEGPERLQEAASLLDQGADINGLHEFRKFYPKGGGSINPLTKVTALYDAAERGDYEAVQFLLSRGAEVRAKNITGMGMYGMWGFPKRTVETLCGLDAMRTSKNMKIVQLAEELYGVETEEDWIRRRDAFDELMPPKMARSTHIKKDLRRVKSVLPKSRAKKNQPKKSHPDGTEKRETRYNLRSRNSRVFYG